jgi:5'-nucleotidase
MRFVNGNTPTILWDMDGTMYHWSQRLNEILLELDPAFPVVPEGQRVGFDYFWVPGADREVILAAMNDPRLYQGLEPIEGVLEAIAEIEAAGIDQLIVSTPTWTNPGCVPGKLASLEKDLGAHWAARLVLTHDKTVVKGDALIDDKPEITGLHTPTWRHVMAHQDYNGHIDTPLRLTDPRQWRETLAPILGSLVPA